MQLPGLAPRMLADECGVVGGVQLSRGRELEIFVCGLQCQAAERRDLGGFQGGSLVFGGPHALG